MGKPLVTYKKRRVASDADAADLAPLEAFSGVDHPLTSPVSGNYVFARVSVLKYRGAILAPAGDVYLRYGEHFGEGAGFGFQHIWKGHFAGVSGHDDAVRRVALEVATVLQRGLTVFYDPDRQKEGAGAKVHVKRVQVGMVVLEYRPDDGTYSVVTGGFNPANTKGSAVGALV